MRIELLRSTTIVVILAFSHVLSRPVIATDEDQIDFNRDVRPIFTQHCSACHGGVKQAADLSFVYEKSVRNVVEPGSADRSLLVQRISDEDEENRMPPSSHGRRLSSAEVSTIQKWIELGAPWERHWAYQVPKRASADVVALEAELKDWCHEPMDTLVVNRIRKAGMLPAEDEIPERWLRRVSLDLVGLPPETQFRERFLSELPQGEIAYRNAVDTLLASSSLGERWASVWFDQVRYADSFGYGEDSPRNVWKYRDWVIDAINSDMPYDEFTIKQIAGDLIPNRTLEDHLATAVHRLTQTNEEGGTDDEEFRTMAILDRVSTSWQTWQAMTFGCVQCHDHPYDPFEHRDYYRFAAFFNNTADCDLSDDWPLIDVPLNTTDYSRAGELDRERDLLTQSLWQARHKSVSDPSLWAPLKISHAKSSNATKVVVESSSKRDEYRTVGTISQSPAIVTELTFPADFNELTGLRITILPVDEKKALADAELGFVMSNIQARLVTPTDGANSEHPSAGVPLVFEDAIGDEPFPRYDPQDSIKSGKDGKSGYSAYPRMHHPRSVVLVLGNPVSLAAGAKLVVTVKYNVFELAAFPLVGRRGYFEASNDRRLTSQLNAPAHLEMTRRLSEIKMARSAIDSTTLPILNERPEHLKRPTHLFIRGAYLSKGDEVKPGVPQSLSDNSEQVTNRLELAKWLVRPENPLTARVAVNRMWARMFGIGLVSTEEDFGSTGESPSHPELLDDLAVRFRGDYGWSVKRLLRELALSHTYRQSSRIDPKLAEIDPKNRLLARGPRQALPAEMIRDQMLFASGLLSTKLHGEPTFPPLPDGVWKARRGTWNTPEPGKEERYRRSVYVHIKRSIPFPMLTTFDAPTRDFCNPQRLRSNTPLQPLMLLNDKSVIECAQSLAKLMTSSSQELHHQLRTGFVRTACRQPRSEEVSRLIRLYEQVASKSDRAVAMEAVASVLLNMDEVLTK